MRGLQERSFWKLSITGRFTWKSFQTRANSASLSLRKSAANPAAKAVSRSPSRPRRSERLDPASAPDARDQDRGDKPHGSPFVGSAVAKINIRAYTIAGHVVRAPCVRAFLRGLS